MKVIRTFKEFYKLIKPVHYDDFEDLEINSVDEFRMLGLFYENHLPELISFCKKNPQYHVVSCLASGVKLNRPSKGAFAYQLAIGDNDPELMYVEKLPWKAYEHLKMLEFNCNHF